MQFDEKDCATYIAYTSKGMARIRIHTHTPPPLEEIKKDFLIGHGVTGIPRDVLIPIYNFNHCDNLLIGWPWAIKKTEKGLFIESYMSDGRSHRIVSPYAEYKLFYAFDIIREHVILPKELTSLVEQYY